MRSAILDALVATPGNRIAVRDDQRSLSYADLREAVHGESAWLRHHGVERCALLADNGAAWIIADLALLHAQTLNVPIPPWFTHSQTEHVLENAGIDSILTDEPDRVPAAFESIAVSPHTQLSLFRRRARLEGRLEPRAIKVTYTSGSTGFAKGVCLTRETIERVARSIAHVTPLGVARHLCIMPLATLLENIAGVYVPLLIGATCIATSTRAMGIGRGALDPTRLLETVSRCDPNSLILVPELLRLLIGAAKHGWKPPADLRLVAVGGASVAPELLAEAEALGIPAYEGYGLSECASVVCLNTPSASRRGSVGKPLAHASVRIDAQGQIIVRGAVMSGYVGESATRGDEIATGDLGYVDADGFVYVRGRLKNMFITSMGRNVSPEWVESHLLRDNVIGQAVVFGEARPFAVALLHPIDGSIDASQIQRAITAANAQLPVYAQIRRWALLPGPLRFSDGLLTANGRPRRDAIAAHHRTLIESMYAEALAS